MMKAAGLLALVASFSLSDSVHDLTPDNFNEHALSNPLPVVVDFYAKWCGPCMEMKPLFEKVCGEFEGEAYCAAYNIEQDDDAEQGPSFDYNARDLPVIAFFHSGIQEQERRAEGRITEQELRKKKNKRIHRCASLMQYA